MSGHSKWSTIKHRKGAQDAKRSKIFTKIIKEITVATRLGGEDADANPRLRAAILLAKSANMPNDNIKRAIAKGAGGAKGDDYEEIVYEGFGPNQVAVIVECLTDNRNRTVSSVRTIFNKKGGNMGSSGSVMFNFTRIGLIEVPKASIEEDALMELIIEAGAQELDTEGEALYEVHTDQTDLAKVQGYLEEKGVEVSRAVLYYLPQNKAEITTPEDAEAVMAFLEALEDDDDVQVVYSNVDFSDEALAGMDE
ncbi:MAG: YebC/PmpR family DNA-binding transcriptional regulator [bacterium]|nr:YebC/PmpR family DNA-binding transcriptional regulator [bacterium]